MKLWGKPPGLREGLGFIQILENIFRKFQKKEI
jgi:hypothetical protein